MLPAMRSRSPVHNPRLLGTLILAEPHPVSLPAFQFHARLRLLEWPSRSTVLPGQPSNPRK